MKSYPARRGGPCRLCDKRFDIGDAITRWPGGRAHLECAERGTPVGSRKRERGVGMKGVAVLKDGTRIRYHDYLRHPAWRTVRLRRMKKDDFSCVVCGSHHDLQVHHLTYRRLGQELINDLRTVCATCHTMVSEVEREDPNAGYWLNRDLFRGSGASLGGSAPSPPSSRSREEQTAPFPHQD